MQCEVQQWQQRIAAVCCAAWQEYEPRTGAELQRRRRANWKHGYDSVQATAQCAAVRATMHDLIGLASKLQTSGTRPETEALKETVMDKRYNLNGGFKPTLKRTADLDGPDFYPTPAWVTLALIKREQFIGNILEPACGDGAMAEVLKHTGNPVISSDLYDRGYGETGHDFLTSDHVYDNIVTNPPFHSAEAFVKKGIQNSRKKFALLLRLGFLEGSNRHRTIFAPTPPSRVWVFCERVTFYAHGAVRRGSGTTAYAWYVWDRAAPSGTRLMWIKPGSRACQS